MDIFIETLRRLYLKQNINEDKLKEYKNNNKISQEEYEYIIKEMK